MTATRAADNESLLFGGTIRSVTDAVGDRQSVRASEYFVLSLPQPRRTSSLGLWLDCVAVARYTSMSVCLSWRLWDIPPGHFSRKYSPEQFPSQPITFNLQLLTYLTCDWSCYRTWHFMCYAWVAIYCRWSDGGSEKYRDPDIFLWTYSPRTCSRTFPPPGTFPRQRWQKMTSIRKSWYTAFSFYRWILKSHNVTGWKRWILVEKLAPFDELLR